MKTRLTRKRRKRIRRKKTESEEGALRVDRRRRTKRKRKAKRKIGLGAVPKQRRIGVLRQKKGAKRRRKTRRTRRIKKLRTAGLEAAQERRRKRRKRTPAPHAVGLGRRRTTRRLQSMALPRQQSWLQWPMQRVSQQSFWQLRLTSKHRSRGLRTSQLQSASGLGRRHQDRSRRKAPRRCCGSLRCMLTTWPRRGLSSHVQARQRLPRAIQHQLHRRSCFLLRQQTQPPQHRNRVKLPLQAQKPQQRSLHRRRARQRHMQQLQRAEVKHPQLLQLPPSRHPLSKKMFLWRRILRRTPRSCRPASLFRRVTRLRKRRVCQQIFHFLKVIHHHRTNRAHCR